ncbi:MAG: hypothetical protein QOD58_4384 [Mycobacterium sp.]|nr:hypothetical protein [Mycobacterium sp.]
MGRDHPGGVEPQRFPHHAVEVGQRRRIFRDRQSLASIVFSSWAAVSKASVVKQLRAYYELDLLEPASVDPHTGYRRYTIARVPTTH